MTVQKHEVFEKICASASLGKATPEDLVKLERHVVDCPSCWQAYHEYVSTAALEFASVTHDLKLSSNDAKECLDSDLFIRRWFDRAEREGIAFSKEVRHPVSREKRARFPLSPSVIWREYATTLVYATLVVLALSTGYLYWGSTKSTLIGLERDPGSQDASAPQIAKRAMELTVANQRLRAEIDGLNQKLADAEHRISTSEASGQNAIDQEQRDFAAQRDQMQLQSLQLQSQLETSRIELSKLQSLAGSRQTEAEEQRKRAGDLETSLAIAQNDLNDITGKLKEQSAAVARERELLAMGRDVTDLMGARNLHILDVADTDSRGKTRPAFGRIFFTEGKSLVFYAYDLNEAKMEKANLQYQVWAKKEGPNRPVRRLGIFYSDDKAQNRWVFKCDDAKVVKEIDSVFVTLGRPNSDSTRPEGAPLMFAYLHGAPNHP